MFIGELSKQTNLSIDTLRYYEKIGLIRRVTRDQGGRRVYDKDQLGWIQFLKVLKATGMPLKQMIEYAEMRQQGQQTTKVRLELLREHFAHIQSQLKQLQTSHDLVEAKIQTYADALEQGEIIPIVTCTAFTNSNKDNQDEHSS